MHKVCKNLIRLPNFTLGEVQIQNRHINFVNDRLLHFGGNRLTADIRIGSRRIISWILSPIMTTVDQAAREK
jgi:hypothetical protein